MKCPKKNKYCQPSVCFMASKNNYICSGISRKPTKYKKDVVWLCLSGVLSQTSLEMTCEETLGIISALTASLFSRGNLENDKNKSKNIRKENKCKDKKECKCLGS